METEKFSPLLFAKDLGEWRAWLDKNCQTATLIYVVVYHKSSPKESVHWHEVIEHALCFGWVDSIAHKRDGESCYLKFSPRKPKSQWGKRNIERAKKMIDSGQMRPPGQALIDLAKSQGKWPG